MPSTARAMCLGLLMTGVIGILGCSSPQRRSQQDKAADRALSSQVNAALQSDDRIYASHIDVEARSGVVWLTGWVQSAEEDREAVRASAKVPGVQRVVDGMEIKDYFPH